MVMLRRPWPLTLAFVVGQLLFLLLALALTGADASPKGNTNNMRPAAINEETIPEDMSDLLQRDPSYVLGMLTKLRSTILKKPLENTKRGIDFGLGRGYSGNQAAKHFMGMVASQYAGGPGKKRKRSDPLLALALRNRAAARAHLAALRHQQAVDATDY